MHLVEVAPPPKLIGAYVRGEIPWEVYESRYLWHLGEPHVTTHVDTLAWFALHHDVTILCIEERPWKCHRRLLAEECRRRCPGLTLMLW